MRLLQCLPNLRLIAFSAAFFLSTHSVDRTLCVVLFAGFSGAQAGQSPCGFCPMTLVEQLFSQCLSFHTMSAFHKMHTFE